MRQMPALDVAVRPLRLAVVAPYGKALGAICGRMTQNARPTDVSAGPARQGGSRECRAPEIRVKAMEAV